MVIENLQRRKDELYPSVQGRRLRWRGGRVGGGLEEEHREV